MMDVAETVEISRLVQRPKMFAGNKEEWRFFKNNMINYMSAVKVQYLVDMKTAADLKSEVNDEGNEGLRQRSVALYSVLYSFLDGDARSIADELEDSHNGLSFGVSSTETWSR